MSSAVECIKNFRFEESNFNEYTLRFDNQKNDYISIDWTSKTIAAVWDSIELYTSAPYFNVLPVIVFDNVEEINGKELEYANNALVSPKDCMSLFDSSLVLEKALELDVECTEKLYWLYKKWSEGFYVFVGE